MYIFILYYPIYANLNHINWLERVIQTIQQKLCFLPNAQQMSLFR